MAEGWLTFADALEQAQRIKENQTRNRLSSMALQEALKQQGVTQQKNMAFDKWVAGGKNAPNGLVPTASPPPNGPGGLVGAQPIAATPPPNAMAAPQAPPTMTPQAPGGQQMPSNGGPAPVTPQAQAMPTPTPDASEQGLPGEGDSTKSITPEEYQSALRGSKMINSMQSRLTEAFRDVGEHGKEIKKTFSMAENSPDIQAAMKLGGLENFKGNIDEDNKTASISYDKNYTAEELTALAEKFKGKGGSLIEQTQNTPGKYSIDYDPVSESIRSFKGVSTGRLSEKNLSKEQLQDIALHDPDPKKQQQAKDILSAGGPSEKNLTINEKSIASELEEELGRKPTVKEIRDKEKKEKFSERSALLKAGVDARKDLYLSRPVTVYDTKTGRTLPMSLGSAMGANEKEENRFVNMSDPTVHANVQALNKDLVQYDQLKTAEKQAMLNAGLLKEASDKYKRSNVRFVNSMEAMAKNSVTDPRLADLQTKLMAFTREYIKVVTNSYQSSSELSVPAQQKADEWLSTSDSWQSLNAKVKAAQQEMINSKMSFRKTINDRKKNLQDMSLINGDDLNKEELQNLSDSQLQQLLQEQPEGGE